MKFSVTAGELLRVLNFVGSVVEKKTTIPILTHFLIEADAQRVKITGTDLERECIAETAAEIAESGIEAINAGLLRDLVSRIPKAATITLETIREGVVRLSFGRSRFSLQALDIEGFPLVKAAEGSSFDINAKQFAALLEATVATVSTAETRWFICGVHIHEREGALYAASTDDHRLTVRSMALPKGAEGMPAVTLPAKSVHTMLSLLQSVDGDVLVNLTASRMWLTLPGVQFSTGLINGKYPNYQRAIPQYGPPAATFSGDEFRAAVDRAEKALPEATAVVASLTATTDGIVIKTGARGADVAIEHVDAEVHAETETEVSANAKYLSEMTKAWGSHPISLHVTAGPLVFTSRALPEQLLIIMPCVR